MRHAAAITRRHCLAAALLPWGWAHAARPLPTPTADVLLSIGGQIRSTNRGERADFDMAMLEQLPQHTIVTRTPWFKTPRQFTGPLVRDLLARVEARGTLLRAAAVNNYEVVIPLDDVLRMDVIIARLLDGQAMTVRDKGPLFVMYPFDRDPALRSTLYYSRCIWQLQTIDVQ